MGSDGSCAMSENVKAVIDSNNVCCCDNVRDVFSRKAT